MNTVIANKLNSVKAKTQMTLKKNSPEILLVCGVVAGVATVVTACKATLKVDEVVTESKAKIEKIHETVENPENAELYSVEDSKKDLTKVYVQTGVKLVKLYAPSVILGAVSITSVLASHGQMKERNASLAASCLALEGAYNKYRANVVERFGEEVDKELRYSIKAEEIEETVVDEKTGKEKTKKVKKNVSKDTMCSPCAFWFDERSGQFTKDPRHNRDIIIRRQNYWNDICRINGHVMLIDVIKSFDIEPDERLMEIAHNAGWVYDPKNPEKYIDLGLMDIDRYTVSDFLSGVERCVILDPNCSINVWAEFERLKNE